MTDKWLSILNDGTERLICQGPRQCFSMEQLRWRINHLQAAIAQKGYPNWVLYDDHGFRFICAMFALLASGRNVLVPANRRRATIESLLGHDVGLIGFHEELQQHIDTESLWGKKFEDSDVNARIVPVTSTGDWGQVTFCTSGSSGQPKAVTKSVEQLYLEVEVFNKKWRPTANTLFVPLVTHLHIYGLTLAFLLPLLARAGFYLSDNGGLLGVVETITLAPECPMDNLVIVTSPTVGRQAEQIRRLAEPGSAARADRPLPISKVFCAGGKLTDANANRIIGLFDCPITEIFGSTETGAVATREHTKQPQLNPDKPWRLLPGLNAAVVKDGGSAKTGAHLKGELSVWGGHAGGSKEEPLATGDEVKFVGHHQFELLGHNNRICKIEGKRVSSNHLVEMLESCELVSEAAVLPFEKNNKEILLAGVILSPQGESRYRQTGKFSADQSIKEHLLRFLDPVLVPRVIRYLDQMPHNEMGKLPKQALIELLVDPVLPTLPLIEDVKVGREELVFSLSIPMELRFFRGHFENRPIVPGVVLLHWVYHLIGEYWKLSLNPAVVNRLKFSKLTGPGDKLILNIKCIENGVEFLYQNEQKTKFAFGQIPFNLETTDV